MRITFISPPLTTSGGVKVVAIHAKELSRLGHEVTIVSQPLASHSFRQKLVSAKNGKGWPSSSSVPVPDGVRHIITASSEPINESDVPDSDAVIATWWETAEWISQFSVSKGRKTYFIQGHETYPPIPARSRETYRLPMKKIVVSEWLKDLMASEYGDRKVSLVPNTVDRMQFYAPERSKQRHPTVGLLYSTAAPKGLDISLRAIDILRREVADVQVIAFGNQSRWPSHQLPPGSSYSRSPSLDRIRSLYNQCDVWLSASRSEGFNLTALEAMACRTPVVATKTGWPLHGVVEGKNGYLCDIDNADQLAVGLKQVLTASATAWQELSEAAYQTGTTSSWSDSAKLFERALCSEAPC